VWVPEILTLPPPSDRYWGESYAIAMTFVDKSQSATGTEGKLIGAKIDEVLLHCMMFICSSPIIHVMLLLLLRYLLQPSLFALR
jgi:hypothetical protein